MQLFLVVNYIIVVVSFSTLFVLVQSDGPAPPRLNIPGAIPIPIRSQSRNDKFGSSGAGVVRIRRPIPRPQPISNSLPIAITPKLLEDAKPVTEEPEDNISDPFVPQIISQSQTQAQQYFSEPNSIQQDSPIDEIGRFQAQERPIPQRISDIQSIGAQRFSIPAERQEKPKPSNRARPVQSYRETRPQIEQQEPVRQIAERRAQVQRPTPQAVNHNEVRLKKPVAQILRKWTEEHDDGSITWGFENDDGSFKEETIGTDCVTRGRYGYVDPDGLKREYNYETGILCDPNKRDQSEETEQKGFVDYEGNKAVLPNGVEIDLSNMGKKKSKRPGAILQPQQQQQQYYRN